MTSPEEQADLDAMRKRCDEIRSRAFNAMRDALRSTPEQLKQAGQKTTEGALVYAYKYYQAQVEKELQAHLKKWPDA